MECGWHYHRRRAKRKWSLFFHCCLSLFYISSLWDGMCISYHISFDKSPHWFHLCGATVWVTTLTQSENQRCISLVVSTLINIDCPFNSTPGINALINMVSDCWPTESQTTLQLKSDLGTDSFHRHGQRHGMIDYSTSEYSWNLDKVTNSVRSARTKTRGRRLRL